ncbi:hypothetical protein IDM40_12260 [Nocardiopsis sp. HNM0947]|uniref:Uncharacterized protein n=1 Tax=Nocardiopsis coralli TaxID=2772213 RepID=A0ABR9P6J8_9ACTN|nr:hypothetical protein [Nocardiopsis coralli]MBE2999473.1 hypothetical protein [Nocardiopsis coralli]
MRVVDMAEPGRDAVEHGQQALGGQTGQREQDGPVAEVVGLVSLGSEDAPACSDGFCG